MDFLKKIFGKFGNSESKTGLNIDALLRSNNLNHSIIDFDNFICELCEWGDQMDKLTPEQQNFYYNQNLEREVNNGGFEQYFSNSSGNFAHQTILSLRQIGAIKTEAILHAAITLFPNSRVPPNRKARQELLAQMKDSVMDEFQKLDDAFLEYKENLNSLNIEYIKQHKGQF